MRTLFAFTIAAALAAGQTTINGDRTILGRWNAGDASSTRPAKTGALADRPSTCAPGDLYFATDAEAGKNLHFCTQQNQWTAMTGGSSGGGSSFTWADPREVRAFDEFIGNVTASGSIGQLNWQTSGTGVTLVKQSGTWPNIGIFRLSTNTTSGNGAALHLPNSTADFGPIFNNTDKAWEAVFVFKINQTASANCRVGLFTIPGNPVTATTGLAVRLGASNFEVVYAVGGEQTPTVDLGSPIDANWHTLRFYGDGMTPKKVYVQWDGGTPRTVCTSGCDLNVAAGSAFWSGGYTAAFSVSTSSAAAATLDTDYFAFRAAVSSEANRRN